MLLNCLFRNSVVVVEQSPPLLIAHFSGATRGIDDVGKHDRRQDALQIGGGTLPLPGDELLDIAKNRLRIAGERHMVSFGILDEFSAGDHRRELAPRSIGTSASARR